MKLVILVLFIIIGLGFFIYTKKNHYKLFYKYLNELSNIELQRKTQLKSNNKSELIDKYIDSIKLLNQIEKHKIMILTKKIDKMKIFNDNIWKIRKTKNNIEFGYPYTIGDIIVLSEKYINTGDNDSLINTLIHEKIHINQRKNQEFYNKFYRTKFKYIIPVNKKYIIFETNNDRITNPDEDEFDWLIYQNNKLYIVPYLYKNKKTIRNRAFLINKIKDKYIVTNNSIHITKLNYYNFLKKNYGIHNVNLTHPNETFVDIFLYFFYQDKNN